MDWADETLDWADEMLDWADEMLDWANETLDWAGGSSEGDVESISAPSPSTGAVGVKPVNASRPKRGQSDAAGMVNW